MSHASANAARDQRTLSPCTSDLIVVQHRLRDVRRWTPEGATAHLEAALAKVDAALDNLHAEHVTRGGAG